MQIFLNIMKFLMPIVDNFTNSCINMLPDKLSDKNQLCRRITFSYRTMSLTDRLFSGLHPILYNIHAFANDAAQILLFVLTFSRLSPSDCGPFTGKDTIYQVVLDSVDTFPDVLKEIIRIISSPAIIALIFVVFGQVVQAIPAFNLCAQGVTGISYC